MTNTKIKLAMLVALTAIGKTTTTVAIRPKKGANHEE